MEWPADTPFDPFAVESVRVGERVRVDRNRSVHLLFITGNTRKMRRDKVPGAESPLLHCLLHVGDRRLHHIEMRHRCARRKQQSKQERSG